MSNLINRLYSSVTNIFPKLYNKIPKNAANLDSLKEPSIIGLEAHYNQTTQANH